MTHPIAQDFETSDIIAILDGQTHATIRDHFQQYTLKIRKKVKIITMDMFTPYFTLVKQPRFFISKLRLKQSIPRLFHFQKRKWYWITFIAYNISAEL